MTRSAVVAVPYRCACGGTYIHDDGPVCILCGNPPPGLPRFVPPEVNDEPEPVTKCRSGNLSMEEMDEVVAALNRGLSAKAVDGATGVSAYRVRRWLQYYATETLRARAEANRHAAEVACGVRQVARLNGRLRARKVAA